jgi:hypothetical protein
MFNIEDKYRTICPEWISIAENLHVFHFDEYHILYAGTNICGGKIIGSLVFDNDEGDILRYFHIAATNKQYNDFVKKRISYRELILSTSNIYVLDKDLSENIVSAYFINTTEIPLEYLPYPNVFCPNIESAVGFDYSFSLQGKIADIHEAFSNTLSSIGKSTNKILDNIGEAIKVKSLNPQVHQLAYSEGSFKLNFRIKVDNSGFFHKEDALKKYFQKCLDYSINTLPFEIENLTKDSIEGTKFAEDIIPLIIDVYESFHQKFESKYINEVVDSIVDSVEHIEDIGNQIGKGFTGIEVIGLTDKKEEVYIGFIDKDLAKDISFASKYISETTRVNEIVDRDYQEYRVQIYDINTDTRKGTAHIYNTDDIMDKPKVIFDGEDDLVGSIFTESLHLNKWITVKAKAKKVEGKFKTLTIKL